VRVLQAPFFFAEGLLLFELADISAFGAFSTAETKAAVTITDATLRGRNVSITADANNHDGSLVFDTTEESLGSDSSWLKRLGDFLGKSFEPILQLVSQWRPFFGVGLLDAEATVTLNAGTEISATADAKITATSDSQVNFSVYSDLIGGGWADSESNALITIKDGVTITAEGAARVSAWSDNTVTPEVQVGGRKNLYGTKELTRGLTGTPIGLGLVVVQANSSATVTVSAGASITAASGDANLLAINTKNVQVDAKAAGLYKLLTGMVATTTGLASANITVDGMVTATKGDVNVQSIASTTKNLSNTQSVIGSGALDFSNV